MQTDIVETNRNQLEDAVRKEIPPRRVVLRGVLAASCGLLLPAAIFGCDSKKGESSTGDALDSSPPPGTDSAAQDSSPAPSAESAAPAAPAKVSQASVQYQIQPKGEQKCGNCVNFIAESNTCKVVDGQISPEGWCTLWVQKA